VRAFVSPRRSLNPWRDGGVPRRSEPVEVFAFVRANLGAHVDFDEARCFPTHEHCLSKSEATWHSGWSAIIAPPLRSNADAAWDGQPTIIAPSRSSGHQQEGGKTGRPELRVGGTGEEKVTVAMRLTSACSNPKKLPAFRQDPRAWSPAVMRPMTRPPSRCLARSSRPRVATEDSASGAAGWQPQSIAKWMINIDKSASYGRQKGEP
jgi:hypothetical protein